MSQAAASEPIPFPGRFRYLGSCPGLDGAALYEMILEARELSRAAFLRLVEAGELEEIEWELGYRPDFRMANDWHVGYWRSRYKGRACAYFTWSGMEFVWVEEAT